MALFFSYKCEITNITAKYIPKIVISSKHILYIDVFPMKSKNATPYSVDVFGIISQKTKKKEREESFSTQS